jgi:hypothetical protein
LPYMNSGMKGRRLAAALALAAAVTVAPHGQVQEAASVAKAKAFAALLQGKKLEAFAIKDRRDPAKTDRYVAALIVPNAQLLVVAASYTRFMDLEYRLHKQDFMAAYVDLNTSTFSQDKFFVEDAMADGLVITPKRNTAPDGVKIGTREVSFNGEFANPRRRNQEGKITEEDYRKTFADADQRYSALLDLLIEQLKTSKD